MYSELFLDCKGGNAIIAIHMYIVCSRNLAIYNVLIYIHNEELERIRLIFIASSKLNCQEYAN